MKLNLAKEWVKEFLQKIIINDYLFHFVFFILLSNILFFLIFYKDYQEIHVLESLKGENSFSFVKISFRNMRIIQPNNGFTSQKSENKENNREEMENLISGSEGVLKENYIAQVLEKIEKNKRYPLSELEMGRDGIVRLKLIINKKGNLEDVSIVEPSTPNFNKESLRAVKVSSPFPPFPPEIENEKLEFILNIKYVLNQ